MRPGPDLDAAKMRFDAALMIRTNISAPASPLPGSRRPCRSRSASPRCARAGVVLGPRRRSEAIQFIEQEDANHA